MKSTLLFLSALALMTIHAVAADTNLNQSLMVARPLEDVARAMRTYYNDTNYHGYAYAVHSTNAVPGVSYTMNISDCCFHGKIGVLFGKMVATQAATNSTKLELLVDSQFPKDTATLIKPEITKTLERIAKIAETRR